MIDVNLIRPDASGKYSPNLYRWINLKRTKAFGSTMVFETANIDGAHEDIWRTSNIIVGDGNAKRGVGGRRLKDIVCGVRGVWSQSFHYSPGFGLRDITDQFWETYLRIGRCTWDHSHSMHMIGNDNRWRYIAGGRQRECQWCGRVFEAETTINPVIEFIKHTTWNEYRSSVPATLLHPMGSCGEPYQISEKESS